MRISILLFYDIVFDFYLEWVWLYYVLFFTFRVILAVTDLPIKQKKF